MVEEDGVAAAAADEALSAGFRRVVRMFTFKVRGKRCSLSAVPAAANIMRTGGVRDDSYVAEPLQGPF